MSKTSPHDIRSEIISKDFGAVYAKYNTIIVFIQIIV
jgi:hypothetical protein